VALGGIGLVLVGLGIGLSVTRTPDAGAPKTSAPPGASTAGATIEDLLLDLQIVPMDGQEPSPFTLPSVAGPPVALAEFRGRPVLLYFWASW
jgi:cytochrome oxidase Cu insertion factor (SCO1/SenC/PrrC family)